MRVAMVFAALLAICAAAQAKVAPQEDTKIVITSVEAMIPAGVASAISEAAYFRAPSPTDSRRMFPCRLQLRIFDKMRMAQSCR